MFLLAVSKNLSNDEMVKQMQEQVISMQDKQISFLNDTISNTYTAVGIVVALVGIVATVIFTWISTAHSRAKKKMDLAEENLKLAADKIMHAESLINKAEDTIEKFDEYRNDIMKYRKGTEERFQEVNSIINQKMEDLKEIQLKADNLVYSHGINKIIGTTNKLLVDIEMYLNYISETNWFKKKGKVPKYDELKKQFKKLSSEIKVFFDRVQTMPLDYVHSAYRSCENIEEEVRMFQHEVNKFHHEETGEGLPVMVVKMEENGEIRTYFDKGLVE